VSKSRHIKVKLSCHGTYGNYNPETRVVFINFNTLTKRDPIQSIKHEIIHLIIESFVQQNKINHTNKEKLVDLIAEYV